jgi:maltokinase
VIGAELLRAYLGRQRWFAGSEPPASVSVVHAATERAGWPSLVRMLVEADGATYQVVVGLRSIADQPDFLRGHDDAVLGEVDTDDGAALAYDAIFDPELALGMLHDLFPDAGAERARVMTVEQSNSSVVYDDRLILKLFRRVQDGPNPEVEVTEALAAAGFPWVAAPMATLTHDSSHLAIVQPFLAGGVDGWALALTSLRDLFGVHDTQSMPIITEATPPPDRTDPGAAGGDFAAEARRLGETTAGMHVAMASAFGRSPGDSGAWADDIAGQVARASHPDFDAESAGRIVEALRAVDAGPAIRVHGDYHLGQVMRTDAGWYILDFEGEPARPLAERRRPSSPLRDVAGMLRSFHYASEVALLERDSEFDHVAAAWEARNRQAFLDGYLPEATKGGVLPHGEAAVDAVLAAFELEKAVYELGYEQAFRPQWESIPLAALRRLGRGGR